MIGEPVPKLRMLAFEPFDAGSHRAMRLSIERHSAHLWRWITRPGRAWKWRMRLAAAEMVECARRQGGLHEPIDCLFVTSLMSAADLRALVPGKLRGVPLVLYMHENQAAYPTGGALPRTVQRDAHFALTNLTSILAADLVIWNSAYNLESFLLGIESVLAHHRDRKLGDVAERVRQRSRVIWPPVEVPDVGNGQDVRSRARSARATDTSTGTGMATGRGGTRVVWPHRWEHDKGPEELLELARTWTTRLNLRWTILGQRFGRVPEALVQFEREFAERIDSMGFVADRAEYLARLSTCDWVLSTARHEFFGMAVTEAMLAGCLPWLPPRLSYPEILPPMAHGLSPAEPPVDAAAVRQAVRAHLEPARAPNAVAALDGALAELHAGA